MRVIRLTSVLAVSLAANLTAIYAQSNKIEWTAAEKPIIEKIRTLRSLSDDQRTLTTRQLALDIRDLPPGPHQLMLAESLASLVTEGDPGAVTLQAVAVTLAQALKGAPANDRASNGFSMLAQLVRYEGVHVPAEDPRLAEAIAKLEADDHARDEANFTLTDLAGKSWSLKELRGKVVLVNFWATWCPPCRKEMPDLDALYQRFAPKGLVILAISDEDAAKVQPFIAEHHITYPILLDPGRKVNEMFRVEGIPKSFVYNREGKLAAEAIDMRTQKQFLEMLSRAGLD